MLHITLLPLLKDNYAYLLHDESNNVTAVVDPSEAEPILEVLSAKGWQLDYVLSTHHHWDHTGGNLALKEKTGCQVVGYAGDAHRIPAIDIKLQEGGHFAVGAYKAEILFIPGHTLGHIAYYFPEVKAVFCGDTLFSLGCGRLFEGTPQQMHDSLMKLSRLPEDTGVYCGHEYTQANGRFALTVEPGNKALQHYMQKIGTLRAENTHTIPSTIGLERQANPFLRTDSQEIRQILQMEQATNVEVFAELRQRKDNF